MRKLRVLHRAIVLVRICMRHVLSMFRDAPDSTRGLRVSMDKRTTGSLPFTAVFQQRHDGTEATNSALLVQPSISYTNRADMHADFLDQSVSVQMHILPSFSIHPFNHESLAASAIALATLATQWQITNSHRLPHPPSRARARMSNTAVAIKLNISSGSGSKPSCAMED